MSETNTILNVNGSWKIKKILISKYKRKVSLQKVIAFLVSQAGCESSSHKGVWAWFQYACIFKFVTVKDRSNIDLSSGLCKKSS